jgi:hypothetical protein
VLGERHVGFRKRNLLIFARRHAGTETAAALLASANMAFPGRHIAGLVM